MRRKWKLILVIVLASIIGAIVTYRIMESPGNILRHALHLERLPSSIKHLRMGSDVWTDEVRGFYFEIAPSDLPELLAGRQFRDVDIGGTFQAHTIHVSPPVSFIARWKYVWETESARCEIAANEEKSRVIVVFAAH
jgi:hypothetical protein